MMTTHQSQRRFPSPLESGSTSQAFRMNPGPEQGTFETLEGQDSYERKRKKSRMIRMTYEYAAVAADVQV